MKHRGLAVACLMWAAVGLAIASMGIGTVNRDARLLVFAATAVGVGSAVFAARLLLRGRSRWAGLCLVVSIITPTWFAAVLNLIPLTVGLILLWSRPREAVGNPGPGRLALVTRRNTAPVVMPLSSSHAPSAVTGHRSSRVARGSTTSLACSPVWLVWTAGASARARWCARRGR
jgi:hypothetical protein